jgi:hypothetical protein
MDPVEEFLADLAFRKEQQEAKRRHLRELAGPIQEARKKIVPVIKSTLETLAARLGAHFSFLSSPFYEDFASLRFLDTQVWFDTDQAETDPHMVLNVTIPSGAAVRSNIEVLTLDEAEIQRLVLQALREAIHLRPRPKPPLIPPEPRPI